MTHLIIAGHGMQRNGVFDPGATGLIKKGEHKYVVEDLFPAMRKFLPKGHNVVFFDKYKVSNYGNIVALAKQYNASEVTEIHYDAAGSSSASGGHVIIHSDYSPDKIDLALRDAIKKMVGVRYSHKGHEGISGRNNLANVNRTRNAGLTYRLIELGFGTNPNDAKVLTEQVEEYAKELVKAITGTSNDRKPSKSSSATKRPANTSKTTNKSISQMADEIIAGKHGQGNANRRKSLGISQAEYEKVRAEVNRRLGASTSSGSSRKSISQMAQEIIDGKHGSGHENRRKSLGISKTEYEKVRSEVNRRLTGKSTPKKKTQSINQMATRIINDPKAPTGHEARRKWLGIDKATYEKVRKEVNRRLK